MKTKRIFRFLVLVVAILSFLMISSCYYSDYWNSSIFIVYAVVFLMIFHGSFFLGGKFFGSTRLLQFIGKYSWGFYFIQQVLIIKF